MTAPFLEKLTPCEACGGTTLHLSRTSAFEIQVPGGPGEPPYVTRAYDSSTTVTCANPGCKAVVLDTGDLPDADYDYIHDEL